MLVELAAVLFSVGFFGLVACTGIKRILSLNILMLGPIVLLVSSGAYALASICFAIDSVFTAALMIIQFMEGGKCYSG